jgi:hypothetical protein
MEDLHDEPREGQPTSVRTVRHTLRGTLRARGPDAHPDGPGEPETMSGELHVIVYPPSPVDGGRQVRVNGEILGFAHSLRDLTAFLRYAGMEGIDEIDVADSHLIEWHGGGPEAWSPPT